MTPQAADKYLLIALRGIALAYDPDAKMKELREGAELMQPYAQNGFTEYMDTFDRLLDQAVSTGMLLHFEQSEIEAVIAAGLGTRPAVTNGSNGHAPEPEPPAKYETVSDFEKASICSDKEDDNVAEFGSKPELPATATDVVVAPFWSPELPADPSWSTAPEEAKPPTRPEPPIEAYSEPPAPEAKPKQVARGVAVGVRLKSVVASSVKMRAIKWMWPNRFAIGKLGLIGGMPDMGKGLITYSMVACITAGPPLPCGEGMMPRGNVILLTAEDDIEDTVVPRLAAAGANLDRVHIVQMAYEQNGKERMFNLSTDLDALRAKIEEVGNVVLIIIDPLSAYVGTGKLNTSSTTDVRGLLAPVVNLATAHKTSAIGIMHFNKKGDVMNAMLRIADSLAYVAAARHVYVVVNDAEVEDRRVFVKAKNNLSPDKKALTYTTGAKMVGFDKELQKEIWAPFVQWGAEHVNVTATEAMQAEAGAGNAHAKKEAKTFLLDRLEAGPVKADDLSEEAEQAGISKATLRRAKQDLNVRSYKERSKEGKWMWELPAKPRQQYQEEP